MNEAIVQTNNRLLMFWKGLAHSPFGTDWTSRILLTCLRRINHGLYAHVNYELHEHEQKSNLLGRLTVKFPL